MYNFIFNVPVKILFGEKGIDKLADEILPYGTRVLICYGGGSIKRIGLYNSIIEQLNSKGLYACELAGISPNPRIEEVEKGIRLVREDKLDFILAAGGGSVIDCAKAIAAGVRYDGSPWDLVTGKAPVTGALPIGTVLTLSATGSEMNCGAVISNLRTTEKLGFANPAMMPKFSILDPTYTFSVPKEQTAAGTADIMSHTFENYFSLNDGAFLQDRFAEGVLKTCITYCPIALREPENYEARANLMWAGTWAINGTLNKGKCTDWSVHAIEHELSAFYDITHGVGLAVLTPHWMAHVLNDSTVQKIAAYGVNVWNIPASQDLYAVAREAIRRTSEFFRSIGLPSSLRELNIGTDKFELMAQAAVRHRGKNGSINGFQKLTVQDVSAIYQAAY